MPVYPEALALLNKPFLRLACCFFRGGVTAALNAFIFQQNRALFFPIPYTAMREAGQLLPGRLSADLQWLLRYS